ncbi:MAG: His Kinase A (phospho-acceptor) domain protein [candidate division BRC1 bacterium ADurb.BinA364]|nr:MAG: His Kinase A (phospho-acceptor) domain protein [candidate division BRC1 bacterium ADurb.BinA364]
MNDEHIGGYGIVRDIAGQPAMAVQIELPREIYGRGRASVSLLAIFILCAGALFVLTMTLILHSEVLGGLLRLGDSVAAIGRSSDLGKRLDKQASPELQRLANEISCMLDSLERAESERIAREKLHAVLETAGAACHELNQPLQAIIGYCSLTEPSMDKDSIVFRNLKIIESQINRIAEITHKLQGISRYMTREYLEGRKIIDLDRSGGPNFEKISAG